MSTFGNPRPARPARLAFTAAAALALLAGAAQSSLAQPEQPAAKQGAPVAEAAPKQSAPVFTAASVEQALRTGDPEAEHFNDTLAISRSARSIPLERLMELIRSDPQFAEDRQPAALGPNGQPRRISSPRQRAFQLLEARIPTERWIYRPTPQETEETQHLAAFLIEVGASDPRGLNLVLTFAQMPEQFVPKVEDLLVARLRAVGVSAVATELPDWLSDSRKVVGDALLDAIKHPRLGLPDGEPGLRALDPFGSLTPEARASLTPDEADLMRRAGRAATLHDRIVRLNASSISLIGFERLVQVAEAETTPADTRAAIAAALWQRRDDFLDRWIAIPKPYRSPAQGWGDRARTLFRAHVIDSNIPLTPDLGSLMLDRMAHMLDMYPADHPDGTDPALDEARAIRAMFERRPDRLEVSGGLSGARQSLKPRFDRIVAELSKTPQDRLAEARASRPSPLTAAAVERAIRAGDPDGAYFNLPEDFESSARAIPLERLIELVRNDPLFAESQPPTNAQTRQRPRTANALRHRAFTLISERIRSEDPGLAVTPPQMQQLVPFLIEAGATDRQGLDLLLDIRQMPEQFVPRVEDLLATRIRASGVLAFSWVVPDWLTDSRNVVGDAMLDAIKHPTLGISDNDPTLHERDPFRAISPEKLAALPSERRAALELRRQMMFQETRRGFLNLSIIGLIGAERILEQAEAHSTPADVRAGLAASLWLTRSYLDFIGAGLPEKYRTVPVELRDRIRVAFRSQVIDSDVPLTHELANQMIVHMIYGFDTPGAIELAVADPGRRAEAQAIRAMFQAKPERLQVSRGLSGGRENLKPKFDQLIAEQPEPDAR